MRNALLKELLDIGETFEEQYAEREQTIHNFCLYLSQKLMSHGGSFLPDPATDSGAATPAIPDAQLAPSLLIQYISTAYRYVRHYVRQALEATPLLTFDDFICLVILMETDNLTKMELIAAAINEKAAGMLVIKRLLDAGFVNQVTDEVDRRSRRVSITAAGRGVVQTMIPAMQQVAQLVAGDLTPAEQLQFLQQLMRFDAYHKPRFLAAKETASDVLIRRSIG